MNTYTAVLCHTLVEVDANVEKVGVSEVLKLAELELDIEIGELILKLDELDELELEGVVEEDCDVEETTGGVVGGVTEDKLESVFGGNEESEEDEPEGLDDVLDDVGSPLDADILERKRKGKGKRLSQVKVKMNAERHLTRWRPVMTIEITPNECLEDDRVKSSVPPLDLLIA